MSSSLDISVEITVYFYFQEKRDEEECSDG